MARIRNLKPDPIADAEFIGIFNGEGHLDLCKSASGRSMVPRVRMAVRDDDLALLQWCQARFGGSITPRLQTRSVCWQLTGREAVEGVADLLLASRIPSKKTREAVLIKEALSLVPPRGRNIGDASCARLMAIRDELKELRRYKGKGQLQ
jgi:hypothetical protein